MRTTYINKTSFVLFMISPILGLMFAIGHIKEKVSFYILFIFSTLWGLAFTVPYDRVSGINVDASTYRVYFDDEACSHGWDYWYDGFVSFLCLEGEYKDYYVETISFLVSSFSNNYHLFFMLCAMFFSFFQLKTLKFLVLNKRFELTYAAICLLYLFINFDILRFSQLRFPTAGTIFLFVVLQYFIPQKRWYLLLLVFLPFIHGSFFFIIPLFLFLLYASKYEKMWCFILVFSILFSSAFLFLLPYLQDYVPSFLSHYVDAEAGEVAITRYKNETASRESGVIAALFGDISKIYIDMLVLILVYKVRKVCLEKNLYKMFLFFVSFYSVASMISFIPYASARFKLLVFPILAVLWLNVIEKKSKLNRILYLLPFAFAYEIVMQIYLYARLTNPFFWFMSPVFTIPYMLLGDV